MRGRRCLPLGRGTFLSGGQGHFEAHLAETLLTQHRYDALPGRALPYLSGQSGEQFSPVRPLHDRATVRFHGMEERFGRRVLLQVETVQHIETALKCQMAERDHQGDHGVEQDAEGLLLRVDAEKESVLAQARLQRKADRGLPQIDAPSQQDGGMTARLEGDSFQHARVEGEALFATEEKALFGREGGAFLQNSAEILVHALAAGEICLEQFPLVLVCVEQPSGSQCGGLLAAVAHELFRVVLGALEQVVVGNVVQKLRGDVGVGQGLRGEQQVHALAPAFLGDPGHDGVDLGLGLVHPVPEQLVALVYGKDDTRQTGLRMARVIVAQ